MLRIAAFASSGVASNRDRLPLQQLRVDEPFLHPREDGAVGLQVNQTPGPRNRRMIGRGLVHAHCPKKLRTANESVARQAIAAFRVDALEVAEQQTTGNNDRASGSVVP